MTDTNNVFINEDSRIIYLSDDVNNNNMGCMGYTITNLNQQDDEKEEVTKNYERKPIKIYISSCGGSVYDMWALIDIMLNSKTPIYTYCVGYAMSAAFNIFLAGHKRYIATHARLLYHQFSSWQSGTYQELVEQREEMDKIQKDIESYIIQRTKITAKELQEIRESKKDWYIYADEAAKYGII